MNRLIVGLLGLVLVPVCGACRVDTPVGTSDRDGGAILDGSVATGGAGGGRGTGTGGRVGGAAGGSYGAGGSSVGANAGGSGGANAGGGGGTRTGGIGGAVVALDCGPNGDVIEAWGPPVNRVNFGIVGDGYTQAELGTTFKAHIQAAMVKRFSAIGQPYLRYRKFVNICAFQVPSTAGVCAGSALGCCGDDSSRLATCDSAAVNAAFSGRAPSTFMMDWRAVMLNSDKWWNAGSVTVLWPGGNADAPGALLHHGGMGFHQLAEEFAQAPASGTACPSMYEEVNVAATPEQATAKWGMWAGLDQSSATGAQGVYGTMTTGCTTGFYRSSGNSMMNSLFGNNVNTSFNAISREKIIVDIWKSVVPIDSIDPPAGTVASPRVLTVNVIDPEVISVDWSIDGVVVVATGGTSFNLATRGLAPGGHMVMARAYDNAGNAWIRQAPTASWGQAAWLRSSQTVAWTVMVP